MATLDFSLNLSGDINKLFDLITDYEKLPSYLPAYIKSVKIIEKNQNEVLIEEIFVIPTIIKNKIVQRSLRRIFDKTVETEIISGPAKNSIIQISFEEMNSGTLVHVNMKMKLSLKARFLQPLIKKWYKDILTGILYKMNTEAV